jgi:serine/threonine-protein kinase
LPEPGRERARKAGVELPRGFDPWFTRATADDPSKRFTTASALVRDLAKVFNVELCGVLDVDLDAGQGPARRHERRSPWKSPQFWGWGAAAWLATIGATAALARRPVTEPRGESAKQGAAPPVEAVFPRGSPPSALPMSIADTAPDSLPRPPASAASNSNGSSEAPGTNRPVLRRKSPIPSEAYDPSDIRR